MNPNHGKYLEVASHAHDGCQWNPAEGRGALVRDRHFQTTRAQVIVGSIESGSIAFRLCVSCAALPTFARIQKRRRIGRQGKAS
jgi:hypothetical protein